MNRIGMHSGYFRGTDLEHDVFNIVRVIHEAGGSAVEFMPGQLSPLSGPRRRAFRALLEELDMELIVGAGRSPATNQSSPDPAVRAAGRQFALETMELLFQLGCHKWDGLIHACWPERPEGILTAEGKQEVMARAASEMRELMPLAEKYEIDFCFEVVNRFEHYLLNTAGEALAFCRMIDHPRANILLDVFHMNIEEDDLATAIEITAKQGKLGHFHVGEANRSVPGTRPSHLNWAEIFAALRECGYSGAIILEPFILSGTPYSANVSLWRDLSDGASLNAFLSNVETGIAFIREQWMRAAPIKKSP